MKLSATLSAVLLASSALAAPLTEERRARALARLQAREFSHNSNPLLVPDSKDFLQVNSPLQTNYSGNWAGGVLVGSGYTSVSAEFTVPTPSAPSGGGGSQSCASAWVGIDGDTCTTAILQTGLDFCISGGSPSYDAWYEWYPDSAYDFSGISFSAGDTVKVTVEASSMSSGTATIENTSSGKTVNHQFSGQSQGSLCETNAEWIVEDFESGGSMVPFANFGTVTFTNAQATSDGSSVGPGQATVLDIRQNNQVLTSSSVSDSSVVVKYSAS